MKNKIVSTTYAPLQPPYQVIKYDQDVAIQIGTLIVTVQKEDKKGISDYQIETHSHPVVAYESKDRQYMANRQLTDHSILEGAVWNNVEVKEVTTVCLAGATLSWEDFLTVLEHESFCHCYRELPDVGLYWRLQKLGVKVTPPKTRECTIQLRLMIQPEESGLSLQSEPDSPLFLNVSVAEDDYQNEITHVTYDAEKEGWDSDEWLDELTVWQQLSTQLMHYRYVLRDLLYDEDVNHFTVTYKTEVEQYQSLVEKLNDVDNFVNLTYIS